MTFSLAGRDAASGMLGTVVTSSSPCVAARCAHVRPGVGAAASQNVTDPSLGPRLLELVASGTSAPAAIAEVVAEAPFADYRQLAVVDWKGRTGSWSGPHTLGRHATAEGDGCVAAGNLLSSVDVPGAMVGAFEAAAGQHLVERLVRALVAGLAAGGEEGPVRSCGLLVVDRVSWPFAALRVDWHDDPVGERRRLWELWAPQMDAYVTRALNPTDAPSYGVPGDE